MAKTPFSNRGPVCETEFYNYEDEIEEVSDWIALRPLQSIVVIAAGQMGATSLLLHICKFVGPQSQPDVHFYYIDLAGIRTRTDFYAYVLNKLGKDGKTATDLNNLVEQTDQYTYLILDNYESLLGKPTEFDADFFSQLRGIAKNNFGLIIAATQPLGKLPIPWDKKSSTFHQIFRSLELMPWSDECIDHYLVEKTRDSEHPFICEDIETLRIEARGKTPYFLQVLADHYYKAKVLASKNSQSIDFAAVKKAAEDEIRGITQLEEWHKKIVRFNYLRYGAFIALLCSIIIWFIFGSSRNSTTMECGNENLADQVTVFMDYPAYLAEGDIGGVDFNLRNNLDQSTSITMTLNITGAVHLINGNVIAVRNLLPAEQRPGTKIELRRNRQNHTTLQLTPTIDNSIEILPCRVTIGQSEPIIRYGLLPYLNKIWFWLISVGSAALTILLSALIKRLENKVNE
jgi:hypothetical protein